MLPDQLFHLDPDSEHSLQKQIREQMVHAILSGNIPLDKPLPSSRSLSSQLKVGRNTVILAYEHLLNSGYLLSQPRKGYFVDPDILKGTASPIATPRRESMSATPDWSLKLKQHPSQQLNIVKPRDWQSYPYPFIYGQISAELFPLNHWRECCRDAVSVSAVRGWSVDRQGDDYPELVEQVRTRLLPRRSVWADPDQILVTVGAQHALYLITQLLLDKTSTIGLENPGYVDVRNIASLGPAAVKPLAVDHQGLVLDEQIDDCDYIYVTPSHQSPTTVTMPLENRYALLKKAAQSDIVLIEDDYESEFNYQSNPLPALKSLDENDRVLYVGSLSKTISPGLRMGYLVGPAELIRELRSLRRLMLRHPAVNNQHSMALFLARGYHDSHVRKLLHTYKERHEVMAAALDKYMPGSARAPSFGGSSFWVEGPAELDAKELAQRATQRGLILEPGDVHFQQHDAPRNFFRLGFSAIQTEKIEPGVQLLAQLIHQR